MSNNLIPAQRIERRILLLRGEKVMLDSDLAELYGVPTKVLNQAVKRSVERFPEDFMFRLSVAESKLILRSQIVTSSGENTEKHVQKPRNLRSQIVTSSGEYGGRRYRPRAFTEQGVAMLSSVLRSERAVQVNIAIMRAFVQLRQILSTHADLARKLRALEGKYDAQFRAVFDAIRELMDDAKPVKRGVMGFHTLMPTKPTALGGRRKKPLS